MVKINSLEVENVKCVKAVSLSPSANGLTIIGGKNGQGKTSVLDSIAWALGGDRYKPSHAQRDGSIIPPHLHIVLSNGLIVERSGDNSRLKVIDPNGNKGGQQLLNEFVEQLALDLPKFMQSNSKEKADTLLKIIGVGDELHRLEYEERSIYNQRHTIGQIADQKTKYAKEMPVYADAPKDLVSVSELIQQQQYILAVNGENQRKRENYRKYYEEVQKLEIEIKDLQEKLSIAMTDLEMARKSAENLKDESTAEIEKNINNIEKINIKVRANLDREKAEMEAEGYKKQYDEYTARLEDIRKAKSNLLVGADLPLEGLSVDNGELTYKGYKWDNMSGAEQLKVSASIVRKLNPNCGFVLMDKLEQMDSDTLLEFGEWLEKEGLQVIATRVSTGDECSIIIEDGAVKPNENTTQWKVGQF